MKNILIVGTLALALAGCQTAGTNQVVGTGVGAVGGYGIARAMGAGSRGSAIGAVAGAIVGNSVGASMDQPSQPRYQTYEHVPIPPRRPRECWIERERTYRGYIERQVCR